MRSGGGDARRAASASQLSGQWGGPTAGPGQETHPGTFQQGPWAAPGAPPPHTVLTEAGAGVRAVMGRGGLGSSRAPPAPGGSFLGPELHSPLFHWGGTQEHWEASGQIADPETCTDAHVPGRKATRSSVLV